jgi:hypothetical protein
MPDNGIVVSRDVDAILSASDILIIRVGAGAIFAGEVVDEGVDDMLKA